MSKNQCLQLGVGMLALYIWLPKPGAQASQHAAAKDAE